MIDVINRVAMILIAALIIAAGLFVVAGTSGWLGERELAQAPALRLAAEWLRGLPGMSLFWAAAGGMAAAALGCALLAAEVTPARRHRDLTLRRDKLGVVRMSLNGLRRLAEHVVGEVPGVQGVIAEARPAHGGVAFRCRVAVDPEASAPELTDAIRERLDAAVRHHVGQPVAALRLDLQTRVHTVENGRRRLR